MSESKTVGRGACLQLSSLHACLIDGNFVYFQDCLEAPSLCLVQNVENSLIIYRKDNKLLKYIQN